MLKFGLLKSQFGTQNDTMITNQALINSCRLPKENFVLLL